MKVIICTSNYQESFEIEVTSLTQLKDYLVWNRKELWDEIKDKKLAYVVGDSTEELETVALLPEMVASDIACYDTLVIAERVEGEFVITTTMILSLSIALTGTLVVSASVAAVIAAVATIALVAAISFAIGQLVQALAPTNTMKNDPSRQQKNYMFNGIQNVTEQGGNVPIIVGECLFGGVRIAANISTTNIKIGDDVTLDKNIKTIDKADMTNPAICKESTWYRIAS